jgi:hypothetical protein
METEAAARPVEPDSPFRIMTLSDAQGWFISWVTDVLVYIIVINLFAEFFDDHIHIGSFWISILTALLMKSLLVLLGRIEHRVHHRVEERSHWFVVLALFLVIFFGKLAIIEIVNALFEEVELHGILYEVAMIITMIVASGALWKVFEALGTDTNVRGAAATVAQTSAARNETEVTREKRQSH